MASEPDRNKQIAARARVRSLDAFIRPNLTFMWIFGPGHEVSRAGQTLAWYSHDTERAPKQMMKCILYASHRSSQNVTTYLATGGFYWVSQPEEGGACGGSANLGYKLTKRHGKKVPGWEHNGHI